MADFKLTGEQSFDQAISGVGVALGFTILAEGILVAILPEVTVGIAVSISDIYSLFYPY